MYNAQTGEAKRALFVLDKAGIIRWCHVAPDGILTALEKLAAPTPATSTT